MFAPNLALVVGPNLLWPADNQAGGALDTSAQVHTQLSAHNVTTAVQSVVCEQCITYADWFFGEDSGPVDPRLTTPPAFRGTEPVNATQVRHRTKSAMPPRKPPAPSTDGKPPPLPASRPRPAERKPSVPAATSKPNLLASRPKPPAASKPALSSKPAIVPKPTLPQKPTSPTKPARSGPPPKPPPSRKPPLRT